MLVTHKETGIKGVESMSPLTFITVSQEQKQILLLSALHTVFPGSFYQKDLVCHFCSLCSCRLLPLPTLYFQKSSISN